MFGSKMLTAITLDLQLLSLKNEEDGKADASCGSGWSGRVIGWVSYRVLKKIKEPKVVEEKHPGISNFLSHISSPWNRIVRNHVPYFRKSSVDIYIYIIYIYIIYICILYILYILYIYIII